MYILGFLRARDDILVILIRDLLMFEAGSNISYQLLN